MKQIIAILILTLLVLQTASTSCLRPDQCYVTKDLSEKKFSENDEQNQEPKILVSNSTSIQIALVQKMPIKLNDFHIISSLLRALHYPPPDLV